MNENTRIIFISIYNIRFFYKYSQITFGIIQHNLNKFSGNKQQNIATYNRIQCHRNKYHRKENRRFAIKSKPSE